MKNSNLKEAKFFCESCGAEVPRNSKVCTTCGKFFAAVRCPKCGKTGTTDGFKNGCPDCGYAVHPVDFKRHNINRKKVSNSNIDKRIFNKYISNNKRNVKNNQDGSIPLWIYICCIIVLIIMVILLYSCL